MEYQNFLESLKQVVEKKLGNEYQVQRNQVLKNNGIELEALVILKEGEYVTPNIYMEYYYDRYKDGESLDEIGDEVLNFYEEMVRKALPEKKNYLDLKKYRNAIYYRVVHYEKNKKLLEKIPHIRYLDLAITFYCKVGEDGNGLQSFCITYDILKQWDMEEDELYQVAKENTPYMFPPRVCTMKSFIDDLVQEEEQNNFWKDSSEFIPITNKQCYDYYVKQIMEEIDWGEQMYIITNRCGVNGAATLLYPELLHTFSEKCKNDLFVLPSSIHEIIVIPKMGFEKNDLIKMVKEVNENQVAEDEILSDCVYEYNRELRRLEI